MAIEQIQNTFTFGELDPLLLGRVDFEGYYKGARKLRNTLVIPQGGLINTFGTTFVNIVTDSMGNVVEDIGEVKFLVFTYSKTKNYLIVLRPLIDTENPTIDLVTIDVYLDGMQVAANIPTPWVVSQLDTMGYIRAPDRVLFLHHDRPMQQLVNGGNDATWTLSTQPILFYPQYDFSQKDGGVAVYTGATVTFTPSATTGAVTITVANATPLTSNHIGGLYYGNGGVLRITAVASTSSFSGYTIEDFTNTNAIRGDRSLLTEPMWGNGGGAIPGVARGWPNNGTIFQNRLMLANSPPLPNVFSASVSFNFNNFDTSEADDDNAFSYAVGGDQLNEINHLIGGGTLVAITTNSLFSTDILLGAPLTPDNIFMTEQNREGSNDVLAQIIDDQILYVDEHAQNVKSVEYSLLQSKFTTDDASLLAPHLIRGPREAAIFNNPYKAQGNYYFLVNADDGTLAVYQTLKSQNVSAWTLHSTQGEFLDICSNRAQCFLLVRRQVLGVGFNQVVFRVNPGFNNFTNITEEVDTATALSPVQLYVDFNSTQPDVRDWTGDYLVFGNSTPFYNLGFALAVPSDADIEPTFEYLGDAGNGPEWMEIENVVDTTIGLTVDGTMVWGGLETRYWKPETLNGIERKFWMRIKRTSSLVTVLPWASSILCDRQESFFIEQLAFDYLMHCSVSATTDANGNLNVPAYLAGQQVYALEQTSNTWGLHAGISHGPFTVSAFGNVSIGENWPNKDFVVGIWAPPEIELMPPVAQLQTGSNVYLPKYIQSFYVDYFESAGIIVAGREIPILRIGIPAMDTPLELQSGFWEINPVKDWNPRTVIPITTVNPLPFTIRGVGYKVEV